MTDFKIEYVSGSLISGRNIGWGFPDGSVVVVVHATGHTGHILLMR